MLGVLHVDDREAPCERRVCRTARLSGWTASAPVGAGWMTETRERLETVRISNDPQYLAGDDGPRY